MLHFMPYCAQNVRKYMHNMCKKTVADATVFSFLFIQWR